MGYSSPLFPSLLSEPSEPEVFRARPWEMLRRLMSPPSSYYTIAPVPSSQGSLVVRPTGNTRTFVPPLLQLQSGGGRSPAPSATEQWAPISTFDLAQALGRSLPELPESPPAVPGVILHSQEQWAPTSTPGLAVVTPQTGVQSDESSADLSGSSGAFLSRILSTPWWFNLSREYTKRGNRTPSTTWQVSMAGTTGKQPLTSTSTTSSTAGSTSNDYASTGATSFDGSDYTTRTEDPLYALAYNLGLWP